MRKECKLPTYHIFLILPATYLPIVAYVPLLAELPTAYLPTRLHTYISINSIIVVVVAIIIFSLY